MDVAALRSKVTFQKNETVTDKYGNHKNVWTDYYTCFATIGGEGLASSKEEQVAGTTVEENIDHMNFRKRSLKFTCRKERR